MFKKLKIAAIVVGVVVVGGIIYKIVKNRLESQGSSPDNDEFAAKARRAETPLN